MQNHPSLTFIIFLLVFFSLLIVWTLSSTEKTKSRPQSQPQSPQVQQSLLSDSKLNQIKLPLYFHVVNQPLSVLPSNFYSQVLPQFLDIWKQTHITFTSLKTDQLNFPPPLIDNLLYRHGSEEFYNSNSSLFNSDAGFHVFLVAFISPSSCHGRAYHGYTFCCINLSNYGHSLPRTLAHEVGHLFGLHHPTREESIQDPSLLMTPGKLGTKLRRSEIETVERNANILMHIQSKLESFLSTFKK